MSKNYEVYGKRVFNKIKFVFFFRFNLTNNRKKILITFTRYEPGFQTRFKVF